MDIYPQIVRGAIEADEKIKAAIEIAKKNSEGKIWMVGGFVFRNIASFLYKLPKPNIKDVDFVVEKVKPNDIPSGWQKSQSTQGGLKLIGDKLSIDLIELSKSTFIRRNELEPTIENLISKSSLNIQSIAYDLDEMKIIGNLGVKALESKIISVTGPEELIDYTNRKKIQIEEYIKSKLEGFKFDWESLPSLPLTDLV